MYVPTDRTYKYSGRKSNKQSNLFKPINARKIEEAKPVPLGGKDSTTSSYIPGNQGGR